MFLYSAFCLLLMDADWLIRKCKEHLRILDNYYIPEKERLEKVQGFLEQVIGFEYRQIKILDSELESVFDVLCKDIVRQSSDFISSGTKNLGDAKNLLYLILSIESYLSGIEKLPWKIGRKLSFLEKIRIRRIFRKKLHRAAAQLRPVRGTRARIELTGSLARGYSDWKLINGGDIPKPSDYNIPREFRKASKSVYRKLDEQLNLPRQLKPLMSDVDFLIMNEVIFDSINPNYSYKGWSFKLGEKYQTGVGASIIMEKLHQSLINAKIGGIKGRWVNYVVIRDEAGYRRYQEERLRQVQELEQKTGKKIEITDVLILDEIIR